MPLEYTLAKAQIIKIFEKALHLHREGRFDELHREIAKEYQLIYDQITSGKFKETLEQQSQHHMSREYQKVGRAWGQLQAYQEALGSQFKKLFQALQVLDSWISDCDPSEGWNGHSQQEWPEVALSVINDLNNDRDLY